MEGKFRLTSDGDIVIAPTPEANAVKQDAQRVKFSESHFRPESFDDVYSSDSPSTTILQYGQYYGQSFEWVLLNDPSYVIYLADDYFGKSFEDMKSDKEKILFSLVSWAMTSPLFNRAFYIHKKPKTLDGCHDKIVSFGAHKGMRYKELFWYTRLAVT